MTHTIPHLPLWWHISNQRVLPLGEDLMSVLSPLGGDWWVHRHPSPAIATIHLYTHNDFIDSIPDSIMRQGYGGVLNTYMDNAVPPAVLAVIAIEHRRGAYVHGLPEESLHELRARDGV